MIMISKPGTIIKEDKLREILTFISFQWITEPFFYETAVVQILEYPLPFKPKIAKFRRTVSE